MTNNDMLNAWRFCQRPVFSIAEIWVTAVPQTRAIKPTIGWVGEYEIPLQDEIGLERVR